MKPKKRTGFTMMEMMITLAIMAILFGLAVPAVAVIQKNLEIARLNSYAKDVYLAAQNRLTSLKATGELVELRDVLRKDYAFDGAARGRYYGPSDEDDPAGSSFKPQDWDTDWDKDENGASSVYSRKYYDFFGIMHNPTDPADNDPVVTEIIPELSVTSTSLDHHYYIEFNPNTGDVYAAFYTDAKSGFTAEDIRNLPDGDDHGNDSGRAKAYRRDDFVNSAGENVMIGYYRGDPTDMLKNKVIDKYEVTCELVNKEDLYVKVTCDLGDTYWMRKFIDAGITLTNVKTGASIEIPINLNAADSLRTYDRSAFVTNKFMMFGYDATETSKFVAYVLLDALDDADILNGSAYDTIIDGVLDTYKDANAGKDLAGFAAAFKEGCTLQASANVELNFGDRIVRTDEANNTDEHLQNSRFAAVSNDGKSVDVGYVRHLKNLDGYVAPGNEFTINQTCVEYVVQTVFNEETGEYETQTVQSTKGDIYFDSHYTLEGGDTKWFWDSTYLVGEPTGNALRNYLNAPGLDDQAYMTPINFRTAGNNKPVTYNGKYNGLYNFVIAGADSNGNSGLFGALKKATVKDANLIDATVDGGTEAVGYVGGFVGEATDCTFSNVGVRLTDRDPVQNKHYADMGTRVNTLKVFADGATSIGGLAGSATNSTFEYSYAAVQVEDTNSVNAGGLVGDTDDCTFKGCYTSEPTIGGDNVG
ncbi:MAG: prepilin-type N-terminal cleavage/methylation domain-containing protein, partial [Clostridia bacterium]|nr:prepilin-type N-terminal cleavage/methylation domain-containing protein [Clostridia bacterium]